MNFDRILRDKAGLAEDEAIYNILVVFEEATKQQFEQGARWYSEGEAIVRDLALKGGISSEHAAVIIAHLSPQTTWARNIAAAYSFVLHGAVDGVIQRNVHRAAEARDADDPWDTFGSEALKTERFARNLLGQTHVVTVDVWAARIALGRGYGKDWRSSGTEKDETAKILGRKHVYEAIEDAFIAAADVARVLPTTMQATTWIVARNGRSA